jgi:glycosyltransferase involved in cell wall biosynthesis
LKKLDPAESIVHLHGWIKALSPSIGKVLAESGFSVVCTLHDYFTACPNGGFYNYRQHDICRLKPLSIACICTNCDVRSYAQKSWRVLRQVIQRDLARIPGGIRHFISISAISEEILRPWLPPTAEFYLLSNPVGYALPGKPRADTTSKRFLYVGRLSGEKGTALACEAAVKIGASLTVIGDGPLRDELSAAYPSVEFRGWSTQAGIFETMLRSTALIFPSVCYETQGMVVPEALSVGLPVIVSDVTAAREYVDGSNGILFRSGDTGDLAEKMQALLLDDGKMEELSRHAYKKYWETPYSFDKFVADSLSIYRHILEKDKHNL